MNLYEWQKPCAEEMKRILTTRHYVINTSGTGAGKTVITCWVAKQLGMRMLVVCPKNVVSDWADCAGAFGVSGDAINYEAITRSKQFGEWENAHKWNWKWKLYSNTLLVFDEAHRLSGKTSQASKLLKGSGDIPTILLSATIGESPLKLRTIGSKAGLFGWNMDHFNAWCMMNGCTLDAFNQTVFSGSQSFVDGIKEQLSPFLCGINVSDVPEFPDNNVILKSLPVESTKKLNDSYKQELLELQDEAPTDTVAALRSMQLSEWYKRTGIAEMALDMVQEGNSVVIMVAYTETGKWLQDKLKTPFIHGDTKDADRECAKRNFQNNTSHIFLANIYAMGEGISLHDLHGRPRTSIICPTHNAVAFKQALGRTCRAGAKSPAIQYVVTARGCDYENRIKANLRKKLNAINTISNSDLTL